MYLVGPGPGGIDGLGELGGDALQLPSRGVDLVLQLVQGGGGRVLTHHPFQFGPKVMIQAAQIRGPCRPSGELSWQCCHNGCMTHWLSGEDPWELVTEIL